MIVTEPEHENQRGSWFDDVFVTAGMDLIPDQP
jgi:hypothetical protein